MLSPGSLFKKWYFSPRSLGKHSTQRPGSTSKSHHITLSKARRVLVPLAVIFVLLGSSASFFFSWHKKRFPTTTSYWQRCDRGAHCFEHHSELSPWCPRAQSWAVCPEQSVTSLVTLAPKSQPAPRGLMAHVSTSSGSDHTRSQKAPLWGISWLRSMVRIWSRVLMSGERPPCTHRICSSINCREMTENSAFSQPSAPGEPAQLTTTSTVPIHTTCWWCLHLQLLL